MKSAPPKRFMGWKDLVITPAVEFALLGITLACTVYVGRLFSLGLFAEFLIFYVLLVAWTILALKVIRVLFPLKDGVYSYDDDALTCYIWNLHAFLCITNLSLHYINGLLPPPTRKLFYGLLGAKMGKGIISIGGRLVDPNLISVEESAMIGDDALLPPHAYAQIGRAH